MQTLQTIEIGQPELSLEEIKEHLRIITDVDDYLLLRLRDAAIDTVERETNRTIAPTVYRAIYQNWPIDHLHHYKPVGWQHCSVQNVYIPKPPLLAVPNHSSPYNIENEPVDIYYYNSANELVEYTDYYLVYSSDHYSFIQPKSGYYPAVYRRPDAISITFTSGYNTLPPALKQALLLLIGTWYENREDEQQKMTYQLKTGLDRLLSPFWLGDYN